MTEVLMALAIVAISAPFVYNQVASVSRSAADIKTARNIISLRGPVLNYVRMHADTWPDVAQIRLAPEELAQISDMPVAGFIDKYSVSGAVVTDVYLAFDVADDALRAASVARHVGASAAVVGDDGVAYGDAWAVMAPDFAPGDLIYRITRDVSGEDTEKYLHRGTSGEDELNMMQRDLNMGGFNVFDVGGVIAKSAKITSANTTFVDADEIMTNTAYFTSGANIDGGAAELGALRVTGDITGFRNINVLTLNGTGYTANGRVISDRANVSKSVNVARDLTLKSDTVRTISGFDGISVNYVAAPFISTKEIIFYDNFGLTLSGELLMSTTSPLKIGAWVFPSTTPPKFSKFVLERAHTPDAPRKNEFSPLMKQGWSEQANEVIYSNF